MKPAPFEYHDPRAVGDAVELLARYGDDAKVLAGGQSLLPMLNLRLARPAAIVDINRLPGLDTLRETDGRLSAGALLRQRALERWASGRAPILAAALRLVGHAAIRNRGTVGGSLAHADPASELPALLLCLDGSVVARSRGGERVIPATDLFRGPLTTSLRPDELLTETRWRIPEIDEGWGFHEVARRHGDFALVGVAALVALGGGRIERARIALFGAGPAPSRAEAAEQALVGQRPDPALLAEAARAGAEGLDPQADIHASGRYRKSVARTLMARALSDALRRAEAHDR
ncbi:MAG: xanthine dehydrogenase family protein subunit M [Candidatus Rokubacteria bacterium]|nr:xanthine dehydrogenase family protein subunit M [Candidatus Rokubacteria bacterium]